MLAIKPLDKNLHNRTAFDCGVSELNKFLREQASSASKRYLSRTRVLVDSETPAEIMGFHTLNYSEAKAPAGSRLYQHYPHPLPILLLSRLAVDLRFQGHRLGEQLLLDTIFQVARIELQGLAAAPVIGLFVDAKDDAAISFYKKYGFAKTAEDNTQRLWLPVSVCIDIYRAAFEES